VNSQTLVLAQYLQYEAAFPELYLQKASPVGQAPGAGVVVVVVVEVVVVVVQEQATLSLPKHVEGTPQYLQ